MDVARPEAVEADLDRFIRKRHDRRVLEEGERRAEEAWMESEREYYEERQRENRAAWCEYHRGQAERLRAAFEPLIARHEEAAQKLLKGEA